jgi:hypothetical protein
MNFPLLSPHERSIQRAYIQVYVNQASRILLLGNGNGYCQALADDFTRVLRLLAPENPTFDPTIFDGPFARMVVDRPGMAEDTLREASEQTMFRRPQAVEGWLKTLTEQVMGYEGTVTVVDLGFLPLDLLLAELAGVDVKTVEKCKRDGVYLPGVLGSAAETLRQESFNRLGGVVFLLPSADLAFLLAFRDAIKKHYEEMPTYEIVPVG